MQAYKHTVQYYETDRMGITHHSNYIRWMEEARIDYLSQIGWSYAKLEEMGVVSPVVDVACKYLISTTFADEVFITTSVKEFRGVKLILHYEMKNAEGKMVAEADSTHCFVDKEGRFLRLAKQYPEFNQALKDLCQ